MAKSRSERLQQEYLDSLVSKPKVDVSAEFKDISNHFWIYCRPNRMYPMPFKVNLPMTEINQIKYGSNTYSSAK